MWLAATAFAYRSMPLDCRRMIVGAVDALLHVVILLHVGLNCSLLDTYSRDCGKQSKCFSPTESVGEKSRGLSRSQNR